MADNTASEPGAQVELLSSFTRQRTRVDLSAGRDYVLGSDAGSDIVLGGAGIAARHARFRFTGAALSVEPVGSDAIAVNGLSIRAPSAIGDGDWLLLGQTPFQLRVVTDKTTAPTWPSDASPQGPRASTVLTIGRLPECDFTLPSPLVSRHHARLICEPSRVILEDLQSTNGVFVNGRRVADRTALQPGDRVEIATFVFSFTGEALEPVDLSGTVRVQAQGLYKEVRDRTGQSTRRLLDDIDLTVEPGEFVGVFGSSGSGKSTLLDALSGRRAATGGRVLYNGSSLYDAFDQFRSAIGYVPQQDIVHRRITIDHALRYTARLRLPPDTSNGEIDDHIARVLERVGLGEKATFRIDTPAPLSGGQLKRVSLAVELVANPNLLFLDEVTSGLDAATDKRMMHLFADLASDHKTVICVTHSLENIDACHLVALLHQGRLVFFGPPGDAPEFFGVRRLAEVYDVLETAPGPEWAGRFAGSEHYQKYVAARMALPSGADNDAAAGVPATIVSEPGGSFALSQAGILIRRYLDLLLADRRNLAILLLQAPAIAGVVALVFHTDGPLPAALHGQVTFVLVLAAIWFGCLNSAREIVKELPVYLRERSVNLRIAPYVASKLIPLAVLCGIQCVLLLCVVAPFVPLEGDTGKRLLALFAAAMAATNMGLAVSAFVGTNDKAIAVVPILLVPQVVLADAVVRLQGLALATAKVTMISFWAFDAAKATLGPGTLGARSRGSAGGAAIGRLLGRPGGSRRTGTGVPGRCPPGAETKGSRGTMNQIVDAAPEGSSKDGVRTLEPDSGGRTCPKCGGANDPAALGPSNTRCQHCGFDLAHLDVAPNGSVRGILGWLHPPGDVIQDRYRIKGILGKGGFAATYLVEDMRLKDKKRALKEIPKPQFDEQEIEVLSRLSHPSIPDIIDRFTVGEMMYLVLEFGGSRTLETERIRVGGRIALPVLLPWMRQLCEVLAYLHSQQPPIVHRDLKPENILLDDSDRVMLIDFGIAKESTPSSMTRLQARAASYGFSPPEQVMGTGTDPRSDIYALAATVYMLLTGDTPPAVNERLAGKEVAPPSSKVPGLPSTLDETLLRALELNPNNRQQSIREFTEALQAGEVNVSVPNTKTVRVTGAAARPVTAPHSLRIPTTAPGVARPSRPVTRTRRPWVTVTVLTAVAAAASIGIWWNYQSGPHPVSVERRPSPTPQVPPAAGRGPELPQETHPVETPALPQTAGAKSGPAPVTKTGPAPVAAKPPVSAETASTSATAPSEPTAMEILEQHLKREDELPPSAGPQAPEPPPAPRPDTRPAAKGQTVQAQISTSRDRDVATGARAERKAPPRRSTAHSPKSEENTQWTIIPKRTEKVY